MKKTTLILTALVLSPTLLLALEPAAVRIQFAPAAGTSLTKTFENKATLTLDSFSMTGAGATPEMEMTLTTNQKVVVSDEYVSVSAGAPRKLARTFDEIGGDSSMAMKMTIMGQANDKSQNMRLKSELVGKKVLFTWNAEKEEFEKAYDPAEEKLDLLKDLAEDMDFRAYLPEGEVKEGDTWNPDVALLRHTFAPGGSLALVPENTDDESLAMSSDEMNSLTNAIGDKLEGEVKAKLVAVKDVDGVSCATIHIEIKVHSSADMTEEARKAMEKVELPPGAGSIEIDHVDMEFKFEGEADLLWDIAGGHFRSFDLTGQASIKSEQGMKIDVGGKTLDLEQKREMSGSSSYSAKAK